MYRRYESTIVRNFWRKVEKTDGCWIWRGATKSGRFPYGKVHRRKKEELAHRLSYEMEYGEFDKSLFVCHKCDNPRCVRPDHLFLGTNADNMADMKSKGRGRTVIRRGEDATSVKITEAQAREIVRLHSSGTHLGLLSQQFGLSKAEICRIGTGQRWAHIHAENEGAGEYCSTPAGAVVFRWLADVLQERRTEL